MKLCISHGHEDRKTAEEIASVCEGLGIVPVLDARNDWLLHGAHFPPDGVTHRVFVVSSASLRSWWLPFQLGRSRERGIAAVVYGPKLAELPGFVREERFASDLPALERWLRRSGHP